MRRKRSTRRAAGVVVSNPASVMTDAEFRAALQLLDCAATLLHRRDRPPQPQFLQELRRLTVEFDLLRVRLRQTPPESERN
jgi:hypothetical protein